MSWFIFKIIDFDDFLWISGVLMKIVLRTPSPLQAECPKFNELLWCHISSLAIPNASESLPTVMLDFQEH